ncbi:MAG TPA: CHASE2 domain-containing protein [Blastocatellia bacterium]|nr:CHASE2 domain-containing protein [Blastocatellia bacterium]
MNSAAKRDKLTDPVRVAARLAAIVLLSTAMGVGLSWKSPELETVVRDWLLRTRGAVTPPPEIVIVAIDEASIARLGRFPWPRTLAARALERIGAAKPKVIALDVLYSEPTEPEADQALTTAIRGAHRVVAAAQLTRAVNEQGEEQVVWLRPLPEIESAAAGTGHVNIVPGYDGIARALLLRQSSDEGQSFWALAVETVRVAEQAPRDSFRESPDALRIGARTIPVDPAGDEVALGPLGGEAHFERLRPARLLLDYVGPSGSFAPQTYSFYDVLEGRVPAERLHDKYVLIGATAAALGDRLATPFSHTEARQPAELMPGVEILANSLHTILRERFYRELPDWLTVLCTALTATIVGCALTLTTGRGETIKQVLIMICLALGIWLVAYLAFTRWLILFSVVPIVVGSTSSALLSLLQRSFVTNAGLNARISELASWGSRALAVSGDLLSSQLLPNDPTRSIAELCRASAVAITALDGNGQTRVVASHGAALLAGAPREARAVRSVAQAVSQDGPASHYFEFNRDDQPDHPVSDRRAVKLRLGHDEPAAGELILAYAEAQRPSNETLLLCREIAASFLATNERLAAREGARATRRRFNWWPRGAGWKDRVLAYLQRRMLAHSFFVERALRSIEDGLIIATAEGCITFANPRAATILVTTERSLIGVNLFDRLDLASRHRADPEEAASDRRFQTRWASDTLFRLLVERLPLEREITIGAGPVKHYMLRMSAVSERTDGTGAVLGLVASFSDITKQQELQQAKNDVMALVSHELRTPLTAIQAISEVLTRFEVEDGRRREMHLAINDESKRLARMIDDYLDLTRLESGARPLRLEPIRVAPLVERTLLLLDPVAAQGEIRIVRRFAPNLPGLMGDPDLIARAVTNLVANAVKFSSPRRDVLVEAETGNGSLQIAVRDQGCGIPPEMLGHIFEKFFRVPRLEDADAPGTGLGLALVRDIAELHGGRITVESEVGVGSVFTLRLPLKPLHENAGSAG